MSLNRICLKTCNELREATFLTIAAEDHKFLKLIQHNQQMHRRSLRGSFDQEPQIVADFLLGLCVTSQFRQFIAYCSLWLLPCPCFDNSPAVLAQTW